MIWLSRWWELILLIYIYMYMIRDKWYDKEWYTQYDSSPIMRFDFHLYFCLVHSHNDDRGCDMYMNIFCIYLYIVHIYIVIYTKNENPISIWFFRITSFPVQNTIRSPVTFGHDKKQSASQNYPILLQF